MFKSLTLTNFFSSSEVSATPLRKSRIKSQTHPGRFSAALILMSLSVYFLLGYLTEVNGNSSRGYEIKRMQTKLSDISEQQKKLNLKVAENTSMISIQEGFLSANFVPAETPTFLQTTRLTQR